VCNAVLTDKFKDSYQHILKTCKCKINGSYPADIVLTTDCFATKHSDLTDYQKNPKAQNLCFPQDRVAL